MSSIESIGFPLVFKVADGDGSSSGDTVTVDALVRSLDGMQKEALVACSPDGAVWRLSCDEGPYLNGNDAAPFPLGHFTAGMQFCFLSQFLQGARAQGVPLDAVSLEQDNYYSMEGSFLRGDAHGGAKPARLKLKVDSRANPNAILALAEMARASSPTQSLMHTVLDNTFSVNLNGQNVSSALARSPTAHPDPKARFDGAAPGAPQFLPDIITRVEKAEAVHGVEGGAGSSLKAEQKRTLHVHGEARWVRNLLMETTILLFRPLGSSFRFLCDETEANGGSSSAPPPLAYTSAGIGFCFMTQLGRYAKIAKHPLRAYRVAQRSVFPFAGELASGTRAGGTHPVDTQVFLDGDYGDDGTPAKLVEMGEQTCFLHAAMKAECPSHVTVELNGTEL